MSTSTSHFAVDAPMELAAPPGGPLHVHAVDLALDREAGALTEARFTFTLAPGEYRRALNESLFHLTPESRGPLAASFVADTDVQVEARLDAAYLPGIAVLGDDILVAGPAFAALSEGSPLLEANSWFALSVTKEVLRDADGGSLREGYSTVHASGGQSLRLAILAVAEANLEERGIAWDDTLDDEVIMAEISEESGAWTVYIMGRERTNRFAIYSLVPWTAAADKLAAFAEAITRINYGLPVGNFELDYDDGEIRFKTAINLDEARMTTALFDGAFDANVATMNQYLPALEAVRDGRGPAEAVRAVEGD